MCTNCRQNGLTSQFEPVLHGEEEWELLPEFELETIYPPLSYLPRPAYAARASYARGAGSESENVINAIRNGTRDESVLTDSIFYKRHPELGVTPLSPSHPNFSQFSREWVQIRDTIVRPALRQQAPDPSPGSQQPRSSTSVGLTLSVPSVEALIHYEIGSESYYTRSLTKPVWPGGASGVTVGIGYDLGYHTPQEIARDWSSFIPEAVISRLSSVSGLTGSAAGAAVSRVADVSIPYQAAKQVFYTVLLPAYSKLTKNAYPGTEGLLPDAQGVLVSLVYNRGTSMAGDGRREMLAIKDLVVKKDYPGMAAQLRSMKRLWSDSNLINRREAEAKMMEGASRPYSEAELVRL